MDPENYMEEEIDLNTINFYSDMENLAIDLAFKYSNTAEEYSYYYKQILSQLEQRFPDIPKTPSVTAKLHRRKS